MRIICLLLVLGIAAGMPPTARAGDEPAEAGDTPEGRTISMKLLDVDFDTALSKLSRMADKNVIVSPKALARVKVADGKTVSIEFNDTPFLKALQQLARIYGCAVEKGDAGMYTLVPTSIFRVKAGDFHELTKYAGRRNEDGLEPKTGAASAAIKQLTKSLEAAQKLNAALQRSLAGAQGTGDRILVDKLVYQGKNFRLPTPGLKALFAPADTQAPGLVQLPELRIVPKNSTQDVIVVDSGPPLADTYTKRAAQFKKAGALLEAAGDKSGAARAYKRSKSAHAMAKKARRASEWGVSLSTNAAAYRKPFDALRTELRALRDEVHMLTGLVRQLLEKNR